MLYYALESVGSAAVPASRFLVALLCGPLGPEFPKLVLVIVFIKSNSKLAVVWQQYVAPRGAGHGVWVHSRMHAVN